MRTKLQINKIEGETPMQTRGRLAEAIARTLESNELLRGELASWLPCEEADLNRGNLPRSMQLPENFATVFESQ
tara:strand:+ start:2740 stop:2961 length:222 start_codon:yes stop_codon:yes gene_type:complete